MVALIKHPDMALQISSYADSRASKEYNRILSLKRARVTKNWLISKGIDPSRLLIKALGEENKDNICIDNVDCSEAEYQLNRKSTFKILKFWHKGHKIAGTSDAVDKTNPGNLINAM